MKRQIPGLSAVAKSDEQPKDGNYLVRITRAKYRWDKTKPFYTVRFEVLEPVAFKEQTITGRVYCSVKALWKLNWFLHDFGYDPELLGRDELDDRALVGLTGVLQISQRNSNGSTFLNLDAFAPASRWSELNDFGETVSEAA